MQSRSYIEATTEMNLVVSRTDFLVWVESECGFVEASLSRLFKSRDMANCTSLLPITYASCRCYNCAYYKREEVYKMGERCETDITEITG